MALASGMCIVFGVVFEVLKLAECCTLLLPCGHLVGEHVCAVLLAVLDVASA